MGEALGSDHINYLVLRYLQEAGHENAAKALYNDWHRPIEYRDPESLPFAPQVRQHDLVNIIQDGLYHDRLTSSVTSQVKRYHVLDANVDRRASTQITNNQAPARSRASIAQAADNDDFPTPAAKRARRSHGDGAQVNGDAMDVDKVQDDAESTAQAETEPGQSEVETAQVEDAPRIETASSGTQTEKKAKPKTKTMYWTMEQPESAIFNAAWNPQPAMTPALLTVGESICRFYNVPTSEQSGGQDVTHDDAEKILPDNTVVSAACWHPTGRYVTCALQMPRQINGSREPTHRMFDWYGKGVKRFYDLHPYLLKPGGMIMALRYDSSGKYLLSVSVSADLRRGFVEVWDVRSSTGHSTPFAFRIFDSPVYDAVWVTETSFVICGNNRIEFHDLDLSVSGVDDAAEDTIASNGIRNLIPRLSHPTDKNWDKIRYDSSHPLVAVLAQQQERVIAVFTRTSDSLRPLPDFLVSDPEHNGINAIAFKPTPSASTTNEPSRLAVAYSTGAACVYPVNNERCFSDQIQTLEMDREEAFALAWSPDGTYLAVSSDKSVKVWDMNTNPPDEFAGHGEGLGCVLVMRWRAASAQWGNDEEMVDGEEPPPNEPSLSWDAEGRSLVFAVGRKVAIITVAFETRREDGGDVPMADVNGV